VRSHREDLEAFAASLRDPQASHWQNGLAMLRRQAMPS
jgi:hypothetical protein